MIVVAMKI